MDKFKKKDLERSKQASAYILKKLSEKRPDLIIQPTTVEALDLKGIDCTIWSAGTPFFVDEKCDMRTDDWYELSTWCLEVMSTAKEEDKFTLGWFLQGKKTNYSNAYLFEYMSGTTDNIQGAELILVKKEDIYGYLKAKGWTGQRILDKAKQTVRETNFLDNGGNTRYFTSPNGHKLRFIRIWSDDHRNGVVFLIDREILRQLAIMDIVI